MLLKIRNRLIVFGMKINEFFSMRAERNKIKEKKRYILYKKVKLSKSEKKRINTFHKKHYGKKIPLFWHRYYKSFNNTVDYFFPDLLLAPKLEKKLNPKNVVNSLQDKNNLEILFSNIDGVKVPKTYISKVNGLFRDENFRIILPHEAERIISKLGKTFVKPTINTDSGLNCQVINFQETFSKINEEEFTNLVQGLGENFVIQELIKPHKTLKKISPNSINTFRVVSVFLNNGEFYIAPSILRLGVGDSIVDNAHAGGIFIGIGANGRLNKTAFTEFGDRFVEHPITKVLFEDYLIEEFRKVKNLAYILHSRIPQARMASWDLTIDADGEIVLIEVNLTGQTVWLSQIAWGIGFFQEHTATFLEEIRKNK